MFVRLMENKKCINILKLFCSCVSFDSATGHCNNCACKRSEMGKNKLLAAFKCEKKNSEADFAVPQPEYRGQQHCTFLIHLGMCLTDVYRSCH